MWLEENNASDCDEGTAEAHWTNTFNYQGSSGEERTSMIDLNQSIHIASTAILAVLLSGCGLLERRDGLFECDYSGTGNRASAPVVYRYYRNSKILAMINQGEVVINSKFSVEEVDEKVLWKQGEYVSYSLNLQTMELKQRTYFFDKSETISVVCAWK